MSESALFPPTTNSITSSSETPQTPSQDAENQEQAELSEVDLGNKGQQDFDELISFSHTFNNYRICHSFATMQEANETSLDCNCIGVTMLMHTTPDTPSA